MADEYTHQLGNSGYALRWAMDAGANVKSHERYRKAVELQRQARIKFKQRYLKESMDLSREAEKEALLARQESLKETCIQLVPALSCYPHPTY